MQVSNALLHFLHRQVVEARTNNSITEPSQSGGEILNDEKWRWTPRKLGEVTVTCKSPYHLEREWFKKGERGLQRENLFNLAEVP